MTRDGAGWVGKVTCEACPVQIEGLVDGKPFYFRARFTHWSFSVAEKGSVDDAVEVSCGLAPGFHVRAPYGDDPFDAGYMPFEVAWACVEESIRLFREKGTALPG